MCLSALALKGVLVTDHSEVRRDAEWLLERDEWMTPFDGSGIEWHEGLPSPYTYQASDFSKLVAAVHEYECVAQSVPALVEALRLIANPKDDEHLKRHPYKIARDVLVVYEQSQGNG